MFSKRLIEPELLEHASVEDARANLADIVRLNERFGGHEIIRKTLRQVTDGRERFTLLDVGAGSGDTARLIGQLYPEALVTSVDLSAVNLAAAPQPKLIADAFELPFRRDSFDYVFCSLFLHHFENAQVSRLLAGFYRVARCAVLISDLERHVLPYFFLPASKPLFGWTKITVHDGMTSIRAGFRAGELLQLTKDAGIPDARVAVHRPAFRISVIAAKNGTR